MLWIDKTHWKYNSPRGSLPKSFVSIRVYRVCKQPRAHVSIIQIHYKLHLHESLQYLSYLLSKNCSIFINTSHNTLYMLAPQNTREHILILRLLNHVNWLYDFASAYVLQNTNNNSASDSIILHNICSRQITGRPRSWNKAMSARAQIYIVSIDLWLRAVYMKCFWNAFIGYV